MASFEIMDSFQIHRNKDFLNKAEKCTPKLIYRTVTPVKEGRTTGLKKGDEVRYDFGNHYVGHVSMHITHEGSHPDAPLFIKVRFAERESEFKDNSDDYDGWISRSWIQEEWLHIDVLPAEVKLPRRYAFRYMQIEIIDTSQKYTVGIDKVELVAESAVSIEDITLPDYGDKLLNEITRVSAYTLQECMQKVFEDGPKRDRRLWLGDLRLQAKANYVTFRNMDLVKRCLYLFGGLPFNNNQISACLFTEPANECDDTYLMDYALFFICTLWEYYEASKDLDTVKDLYDIAMQQITNIRDTLDDRGIVKDQGSAFWCFVDWCEGLNKQACAQAIFIYAINYAIKLAELMVDDNAVDDMKSLQDSLKRAAITYLWDDGKECFISGDEHQVSIASQVWMILAGVLDKDEAGELLERIDEMDISYGMVTPYMYNYYVEALIYAGKTDKALEAIKSYWGGMISAGADTYWELYNPNNLKESPYGSDMVNSYCHAWSCTPVVLLGMIIK